MPCVPLVPKWSDDVPIYRQLVEHLISLILEQTYLEGEKLPSVRQLATRYKINPVTVAKAYKVLARDGLIEKLHGEDLAIGKGVRDTLLQRERIKFFEDEWPLLRTRLKRLSIDLKALARTFDGR